jgi:thiol-disulfide isomerase/thioredoxin
MFRKTAVLLLGLALLLPGTGGAAVPPLPEDLKPKVWKPDPELRRAQKEIEEATAAEVPALMDKVRSTLEKHPDWLDLHRNYIGMALRNDKAEEVKASYRALLDSDSTSADLQYLNGILEQGAGGEPYHRSALRHDPKHYHAKVALGLALLSAGPSRYEEGLQELFEAARAVPDHPYGYMALALAYQRILRDPTSALRVVEMWKKVQPDSPHPLQFEVGALQAADREADAVKVQIQVAEMMSKNSEQAAQTARLLAKQGQSAEAIHWVEEAASRGWDDPRSLEAFPELKPLVGDPGFTRAIQTIEENRARNSDARRQRLIEHLIEKPAPSFQVKTMDGEELSLEGLRGKVVVLDFWATWCGPCRMTLPLVRDLHASMKGKDVEILCMNVWERDPDRAKVAPYWKDNAYPMKVGLASPADATSYGVTGIPTLFVIDQKGQIRFQHVGYSPYMDEEVAWVVDALEKPDSD